MNVAAQVEAFVYGIAADLHPPTPDQPVPTCGCGHPDDDHHGTAGDLNCSVCGCARFEVAA